MPKVLVNGIRTHYLTVGRGQDVVMLHGFLGNLAVWHLSMVPELRGDYRVTTYDLRGHGYSDVSPSGYSTDDLASDLHEFLNALKIDRPFLVGHSYGADVAMTFAARYPGRVRALVAIEPGLAALVDQRKREDWPGWRYWVAKLEEVGLHVPPDKRTDLTYLLTLSLQTPKFYGPARGLPRRREPLLNLVQNTTLLADYETVGTLTLDAVHRLETPVQLIYGAKSAFLSSFEYLCGALPFCEPVLVPDGEHFGPLEQPLALTGHIQRFLGQFQEAGEDMSEIEVAGLGAASLPAE